MKDANPKTIKRSNSSASCILIIDHNQTNIDTLSSQLREHDYSIIETLSAEKGLQEAKGKCPDLILLNVSMPNNDGQDIYRNLIKHNETRNIPVIFIREDSTSKKSEIDDTSDGFHYITVPFNPDEVSEKVKSRLHIRALQTQLTEEILDQPTPEQLKPKAEIIPVGSNEKYDHALYQMLVEKSPDAILVECEGEIIFANQSAAMLYRATSTSDLIGQPLISLTAKESRLNAIIAFRELENLNQIHTQEEKALLLDQKTCDVSITRLHFSYAGQPAIQMVVRDISRHKKLESQLHYQATHDTVTGLPNRNLFSDRLLQAIIYAKRQQSELLVCFIDLDRFKRINDNMGHEIGDQLLVCIAERMTACIRTTDTVARMGGDEFVLLLPSSGDKQSSLAVVERVLAEVSKPITLENQSFAITCSIGYSHYPTDGDDGPELLKYADTAMYHAKESGRNTIQHYNPSLQAQANENEKLEEALCHAIANNELSLQYQVQAELYQGEVTGIEALLRWQSPTLGFISPARFIPIAEQAGLIENITEWIVKTVCNQIKRWQEQGCRTIPIAVNISAVSLRNPQRLENLITQTLEATQLDPTLLELEFTESASMDDPEAIIPLMLRLKALGVRLAIDDFGTGYSNLHYLKQFPIDKLKLDGSFVREITTESRSLAIADAIITMAHRLELTVIAEMVETKEQLQILFEHGCDQIQGYYFSRPLPPEECIHLLYGKLMDLPYPRQAPNTSSPAA